MDEFERGLRRTPQQQSLLCPSMSNITKKLRASRINFPRMMGGPLFRGNEQSYIKISSSREIWSYWSQSIWVLLYFEVILPALQQSLHSKTLNILMTVTWRIDTLDSNNITPQTHSIS